MVLKEDRGKWRKGRNGGKEGGWKKEMRRGGGRGEERKRAGGEVRRGDERWKSVERHGNGKGVEGMLKEGRGRESAVRGVEGRGGESGEWRRGRRHTEGKSSMRKWKIGRDCAPVTH